MSSAKAGTNSLSSFRQQRFCGLITKVAVAVAFFKVPKPLQPEILFSLFVQYTVIWVCKNIKMMAYKQAWANIWGMITKRQLYKVALPYKMKKTYL